MKFNCGPTFAEKEKMIREWHPYFAWWPTRVGSGDCRWLETIERRLESRRTTYTRIIEYWEYRAKSTFKS